MDGGINRRRFIAGGLAVLASLSKKAEGAEAKLEIVPSNLTQEQLERQKKDAITSLQKSIPPDPRLNYLRDHARNLEQESQMYIPSEQELKDVARKSESALAALAASMRDNDPGLFIYADANEKGDRAQRLYIVQKNKVGALQFIKGYKVSMSETGFGNEKDSGKTPLGLHSIHNGRQGIYGEVVSGLNKNKHMFNHIVLGGIDHWFVKNFGERAPGEKNADTAEVVTDQYLLRGPQTDVSRGIRIHGTNRSGRMRPDGTWDSFLGGVRRSGGCIRMSNTDIRDLSLSKYIQAAETTSRSRGTPVMIHATSHAQEYLRTPTDVPSAGPPEWTPADTEELEKRQREEWQRRKTK